MRATIIEPVTTVPLRAIVGTFVGTFGALWLLIEPMTGFGLFPKLSTSVAWLGYVSLLVLSTFSVFVFVPVYRKIKSSRKTFFTFLVISASDGAEHLVTSPSNMMVGDFLHYFLQYLSRGRAGDVVLALQRTHEPTLQIITTSGFVDLHNSHTLDIAGISNDARCQISATPREPRVLFSRHASDET